MVGKRPHPSSPPGVHECQCGLEYIHTSAIACAHHRVTVNTKKTPAPPQAPASSPAPQIPHLPPTSPPTPRSPSPSNALSFASTQPFTPPSQPTSRASHPTTSFTTASHKMTIKSEFPPHSCFCPTTNASHRNEAECAAFLQAMDEAVALTDNNSPSGMGFDLPTDSSDVNMTEASAQASLPPQSSTNTGLHCDERDFEDSPGASRVMTSSPPVPTSSSALAESQQPTDTQPPAAKKQKTEPKPKAEPKPRATKPKAAADPNKPKRPQITKAQKAKAAEEEMQAIVAAELAKRGGLSGPGTPASGIGSLKSTPAQDGLSKATGVGRPKSADFGMHLPAGPSKSNKGKQKNVGGWMTNTQPIPGPSTPVAAAVSSAKSTPASQVGPSKPTVVGSASSAALNTPASAGSTTTGVNKAQPKKKLAVSKKDLAGPSSSVTQPRPRPSTSSAHLPSFYNPLSTNMIGYGKSNRQLMEDLQVDEKAMTTLELRALYASTFSSSSTSSSSSSLSTPSHLQFRSQNPPTLQKQIANTSLSKNRAIVGGSASVLITFPDDEYGVEFMAHKELLSRFSGYFRDLIMERELEIEEAGGGEEQEVSISDNTDTNSEPQISAERGGEDQITNTQTPTTESQTPEQKQFNITSKDPNISGPILRLEITDPNLPARPFTQFLTYIYTSTLLPSACLPLEILYSLSSHLACPSLSNHILHQLASQKGTWPTPSQARKVYEENERGSMLRKFCAACVSAISPFEVYAEGGREWREWKGVMGGDGEGGELGMDVLMAGSRKWSKSKPWGKEQVREFLVDEGEGVKFEER